MRRVGLLVVVCWWLVGCGRLGPEIVPTESVTVQPSVVPSQTLDPTRTAVPTKTPFPTLTPIATPKAVDFPLLGILGRGVIREVEWSPDGKLMAVGTSVGIYLLDANTLEEVQRIETEVSVNNLAFHPDGSEIITGARNWIRFWDVQTGQLTREISVPHVGEGDNWVTEVMINPDGSLLAASISTYLCDVIGDSYSFVWDLKTGEVLHQLEGEAFSAFSQDGSRLIGVWVLEARKVEWQITTGEVRVTEDFDQYDRPQQLSSDGSRLITYAENSPLKIFDVETGTLLHSVDVVNIGPVQDAYLDGNHQIVVIFGQEKVYSYDLRTNAVVQEYAYEEWFRQSLFFSPDGEKYVEIHGAKMELKDVQSKVVFASTSGFTAGIEALAFSPDVHWLAAGDENGEVTVWDLNTREFIVLQAHETEFGNYSDKLVFDPTGSFLAVLDTYGTVIVWDLSTRTQIQMFNLPFRVLDMGFSENEEFLIVGRDDQQWMVEKWAYGASFENPLEQLNLSFAELSDFDASLEERLKFQLANDFGISTQDFAMLLWSPDHLEIMFRYEQKFSGGHEYRYHPSSNLIAMNNPLSFGVDLWDITQMKVLQTIEYGNGDPYRFRFQPQGNLLIWSQYNIYCGLDEQIVLIYNLETEQVYSLHTEHTGNVYGLDISPDGRILATGSADGTIRLWQLP